ncbi:MAG: hypothetical protein ACOZIN_03945, partial [Myxococcota bacterium]
MNERVKQLTLLLVALLLPAVLVASWAMAAQRRLSEFAGAAKDIAVASVSDDTYCTPALKGIIRRVAGACGLLEGGGGR